MKIVVEHIHKSLMKRLQRVGWVPTNTLTSPTLKLSEYRRICGWEMVKDFESMGDAIRNFEKITGCDVMADVDASGCSIYTFKCLESRVWCSGWECGKHLYRNWQPTPRALLELADQLAASTEELEK